MSLEKNILEKIERDHLEVVPKWKFLAREYSCRCLAVVFFALGSVSWGTAIYWVARHDRVGIYNLPYFWGALAAFFVAGVMYLFEKSDSLYKIRWTLALSSIGVIVFTGGYLSHVSGTAKYVEEAMIETVPLYESMSSYQDDLEEASEMENEKDGLETIANDGEKKNPTKNSNKDLKNDEDSSEESEKKDTESKDRNSDEQDNAEESEGVEKDD
jgi:hypothetical protein